MSFREKKPASLEAAERLLHEGAERMFEILQFQFFLGALQVIRSVS